jgi:hypothetical protein
LRTVNRESPAASETRSVKAQSGEREAEAKKDAVPESSRSAVAEPESKKRGRPPGKRSDPGYTQITAYVRTQTIDNVKVKLIKQGSKQDASELIEELLSAWLRR